MKKKVCSLVGVFFLYVVSLAGTALAAELLDVKPVGSGSNVVIEVTADIPMTYTYYKVPGQARAVVDIADADPEKVEALVVVNKGAVSSISVDKAMIGDMTVSRLVFNLVAESDLSVTHTADRKTLNVSFGDGKVVAVQSPAAPAVEVAPPVVVPEPKAPVAIAAEPVAAVAVQPFSKEEEDLLGLDEPPAEAPAKAAAPAVRSAKLEPVVPATVDQEPAAMVVVKGIVVGASYVEIQTNGTVEKFKPVRLTKPERLSIEFPGTSTVSVKSIKVKRFGISNVRTGTTPGFVRVVLDAAKAPFPKYEIVSVENGLRINFK